MTPKAPAVCLKSRQDTKLRETQRNPSPTIGDPEMLRECPYCAESIQRKAKLCRYCGQSVDPLLVDDTEANRQILKILKSKESGLTSSEIATYLNEENDFRMDTGKPWTEEEVKKLCESFSEAKGISQDNRPSKTKVIPIKTIFIRTIFTLAFLAFAGLVINEQMPGSISTLLSDLSPFSSGYIECVDAANKSTPLTAAMVCAKKHEKRLNRSALGKDLKANWENNTFTITEFSTRPGYAVTFLRIRLTDKLSDTDEYLEIPTFYLIGHMGSQETLTARTKGKGKLPSYGWSWDVVEVRGVNTLE